MRSSSARRPAPARPRRSAWAMTNGGRASSGRSRSRRRTRRPTTKGLPSRGRTPSMSDDTIRAHLEQQIAELDYWLNDAGTTFGNLGLLRGLRLRAVAALDLLGELERHLGEAFLELVP